MPAAITAEDLVKRYDGRPVVDGLSFSVDAGEIFAILGPNGAGKTTTVEILEGLRRADAGRTRVLGLDPVRDRRALVARIGVMPQDGGLYAGIRPLEAVRQFAAFYDDPLDPAALLRSVGIDPSRRTSWRRLSGGERQRVSLALALVGRPQLVFLDEPTAGMDVHARARTWEVIRALRSDGVTVLLTTHLLDEAERLADRVAIVHRGRLAALGPPSELTSASGSTVRFRSAPGIDTDAMSASVGAVVADDGGGAYSVDAPTSPALVAAITSWLAERGMDLHSLTAGSRPLEEVFLELTRPEPEDPP